MTQFDICQIRDRVWRLWDGEKDTFYLVEGNDLAAVIDTGITPGAQITPVLRQLTPKPLVLVLTHAHIDHFHHMDEFETVYMSHRELELGEEILQGMMAGKNLDLEHTIHVETDTKIDLGNCLLEICDVPGHTPGSVAVYDARDRLIFTGDAIGSGCGVWMQLPGSSSLGAYEKSLVNFLRWVLDRGEMEFWGGHCNQSWESRQVPGFNPLSAGLLADLIDLVRLVRRGKITGEVIDLEPHLREREARYAAWGRAEMLYNPDKL